MRAVDADVVLYTHKLEQKAIGKDWGVDDLATAIMTAPTIDAIPVEWLCKKVREEGERGNILHAEYIKDLIWEWHNEQEGRQQWLNTSK